MRVKYIGVIAAVTSLVLACSSSACSSSSATIDSGSDSGTDGNGATTTRPDASSPAKDASSGGDNDSTAPAADSGNGGGDDAGGGTDAATGIGPYPAGPYGNAVGDVIANFTWAGYADDAADAIATTKTFGTYSLDDARHSGKKYALINLAEFDCPGCQKSAGEFTTNNAGKSVVDAGGVVIEVLETAGFTAQATKANLDSWINKYKLVITTVKDPDGTGTPTLTALGQREQAYIVDLTTMKILQVIQGDVTGIGATSGGKGMDAMHVLLGK